MNQIQNTEIILSPTEMLSSLNDVLRSNIIQLFIVVILQYFIYLKIIGNLGK